MATPQLKCEALPLPGVEHGGLLGEYVRICPAGHMRSGYCCTDCAGNGAILCIGCGSEGPAILIPAATWDLLTAGQSANELTAEGTGPLLDPDCRDGKCGSCIGPPCEHECHGCSLFDQSASDLERTP